MFILCNGKKEKQIYKVGENVHPRIKYNDNMIHVQALRSDCSCYESKTEGKDQESINSSTTSDPGYQL